jgi:nicotinamidase-related amidase
MLIERDQMVLVVIDIQDRLAAAMERRNEVVAATVKLVKTASLIGAPVLATRQYPQGLGETDAAVGDALTYANATIVDKTAFCCGREPSFVNALERFGRNQVVLAGMETHICVVQTALDLLGRGMRVHLAADACCSRHERDHELALARVRQSGGVVSVFESIAYEAVGQAATDEFRGLLGIVKG